MDKAVFIRLLVTKGVNKVDLSMLPLEDRKEIYAKAAPILFENKDILDAVYCWKESGSVMPKEELIRIANNEFSLGHKKVAVYIYRVLGEDAMAEFLEKN